MTSVENYALAFYHVGAWGAESTDPLRFPWDRWMDGDLWGVCPARLHQSADSVKRKLREAARRRHKELTVFDYRVRGDEWLMFSFKTARVKPEVPFSWLESTC